MPDTMKLYAATTNQGKLREFAVAAQPNGIEVLALPGLKAMPEPVEDAATFMGNAEKKALGYSLLAMVSGKTGLMVFADDSGLEVDALGGEPGVRSARFADDAGYGKPLGATKDERNNALLLDRLALLLFQPKTARFICALALARDGEMLLRAEGVVEGEIVQAPRGENGFGYDPLFLLPALGLTTAELPSEQKWALSHRGKAFRNLVEQLLEMAR